VRHTSGHVEHEKHDGVDRGLTTAGQLPITQVLVDESWRGGWITTALDHFLERTAPVEPGARAAPIPTLTHPVGLLGGADARLEVGKLHLFPQPIDDVVDLEFEQELDFTLVLAARSFLARPPLLGRVGKYIARLGFSLAGALLLLGAA